MEFYIGTQDMIGNHEVEYRTHFMVVHSKVVHDVKDINTQSSMVFIVTF